LHKSTFHSRRRRGSVLNVATESAADKASVEKYCVINGMGGRRVRNDLDAFYILSRLGKGDLTDLSFLVPQTRGDLILSYQEAQATIKLRPATRPYP
jgi:hypothetical protein